MSGAKNSRSLNSVLDKALCSSIQELNPGQIRTPGAGVKAKSTGHSSKEREVDLLHQRNNDRSSMALLVISLTDNPRNPTLMSDLRAMGFNPTLVTAVDARRWSAPFAGHPVDTEAFVDY